MKVKKVSAAMIQHWDVSVKYLDEIAVGIIRLSGETFTGEIL